MNYAQIRAFHLVAQEGSVRRAADVLNVSQPTVSQHLKALEERYGVQLFLKRGRGIALSEAGGELFTVTKRLMESVSEVNDLLRRRPHSASGKLRIVSDAPALAVRIASHLLSSHPDIGLSIRKDSVAGIVNALTEVRADVGIAAEPPIGSSLLIQPYKYEELCVCLRADHELATSGIFDLGQIAGRTLILREQGSRTRALLERAMAAQDVLPGRTIEVEGAEVVREAVASGLGLSFFAESECPPDSRLIYLRTTARQGSVGFIENVIVRRDRRHIPEIAAFLAGAQATAALSAMALRGGRPQR